MQTAVATYPEYEDAVEDLVLQHRKLKNGHLHLAVYLALPNQPRRDVCLFEIIDDFGGGRVDPEKNLFTFAYGSTPGFPLPPDVSLWMMLTNPPEFEKAVRENWKDVGELRRAVKSGNATVIHADAKGKKFWNEIK